MMPAMSETSNRTKPSGWYADPEDPARLRKWDGVGWTDSWMAGPGGPSAGPGGPGAGLTAAPVTLPAFSAGGRGSEPRWHLDPSAPTLRRERYWDGEEWTARLRHGTVFPGRTTLGSGFFTLAAWLRGLFYVQVAVSAVAAVVAVWVVSVLNRWLRAPATISVEEGNRVDLVDLAVGGVSGLLYLVTGVVFIVWLWKAYSSDRVDPTRLRHGRGWTIGAWFVPILNLFRPFQLVRDLRDGIRSAMGATGADRKRWLVRSWWAAFLTMSLFDSAGQVVDRASGSQEGFDLITSMRTLTWLSFGSSLASVAAAALAALLVRRLTPGCDRWSTSNRPSRSCAAGPVAVHELRVPRGAVTHDRDPRPARQYR